MLIVSMITRVPVRLTEERWSHITRGHPEMSGLRDLVLETLADPDMIQEGDFGELLAVRSHSEPPLAGRSLVVVYREVGPDDGFVITAYITRRPSVRRREIWRR